MTILFPQRRTDGSFDVIVRLTGVAEDQASVERWISEWALQNSSWERVWTSGGESTVEVLRMGDDFYAPPALDVQTGTEVAVRFRGRAESKTWKDWMVRFVEEFVAVHQGSQLVKFESA